MRFRMAASNTWEKISSISLRKKEREKASSWHSNTPSKSLVSARTNFLKTAINQIREYREEKALDAVSFLKLMKEKNEASGDRPVTFESITQ